jgi:hypothetical protein
MGNGVKHGGGREKEEPPRVVEEPGKLSTIRSIAHKLGIFRRRRSGRSLEGDAPEGSPSGKVWTRRRFTKVVTVTGIALVATALGVTSLPYSGCSRDKNQTQAAGQQVNEELRNMVRLAIRGQYPGKTLAEKEAFTFVLFQDMLATGLLKPRSEFDMQEFLKRGNHELQELKLAGGKKAHIYYPKNFARFGLDPAADKDVIQKSIESQAAEVENVLGIRNPLPPDLHIIVAPLLDPLQGRGPEIITARNWSGVIVANPFSFVGALGDRHLNHEIAQARFPADAFVVDPFLLLLQARQSPVQVFENLKLDKPLYDYNDLFHPYRVFRAVYQDPAFYGKQAEFYRALHANDPAADRLAEELTTGMRDDALSASVAAARKAYFESRLTTDVIVAKTGLVNYPLYHEWGKRFAGHEGVKLSQAEEERLPEIYASLDRTLKAVIGQRDTHLKWSAEMVKNEQIRSVDFYKLGFPAQLKAIQNPVPTRKELEAEGFPTFWYVDGDPEKKDLDNPSAAQALLSMCGEARMYKAVKDALGVEISDRSQDSKVFAILLRYFGRLTPDYLKANSSLSLDSRTKAEAMNAKTEFLLSPQYNSQLRLLKSPEEAVLSGKERTAAEEALIDDVVGLARQLVREDGGAGQEWIDKWFLPYWREAGYDRRLSNKISSM